MRYIKQTAFVLFIMLFALTITVSAENAGNQMEVDVKRVLKRVSPSIVKVVAQNHKMHTATGVALAPDMVVSTLFVVKYPYDSIYVETVDGKKISAKVVGKDVFSSTILLKLEKKALKPIKRTKNCELGDWAALVGLFYNRFPAIYHGFVGSVSDEELLLNAPVVPGSLGGAVVNKKGELMGIIRGRFGYTRGPNYTYKDHSSEISIRSSRGGQKDMCLAVPSAKIDSIARDLEKYGKVRKGWLGVNLNAGKKGSDVCVGNVVKNSPAHIAGLRKGDVILKIKNEIIRTPSSVSKVIKDLKPGDKTKIQFVRGKKRQAVVVVLGEWEQKMVKRPRFGDIERHIIPELEAGLPHVQSYILKVTESGKKLGVNVVDLTTELAKKFKVKDGSGLMISKVFSNTAAAKAGFETGDVIVAIGKGKIKNSSDLRAAMAELEEGEEALVHLFREGKRIKIAVVPDVNIEFNDIFNTIQDKLKDLNIDIDGENKIRVREVKRIREHYIKQVKEKLDKNNIERYEERMQKMMEAQEKLNKEMEIMRKLLEEEKKKKKNQKTKQQ